MNKTTALCAITLAVTSVTLSSTASAQWSSSDTPSETSGLRMRGMDTLVGLGLASWGAAAGSLAPIIANSYYLADGSAPPLAWSLVSAGFGATDVALALADSLAVDDQEFQARVTLPVGVAGAATLTTAALALIMADHPEPEGAQHTTATPYLTADGGAPSGGLIVGGSF